MSCEALEGIVKSCDNNSGGIYKVWINQQDNIDSYTLNPTLTWTIDSITLVDPADIYTEFEIRRNTGSYTEEAAIDLVNGSSYYTQTITLMFHRRDQSKSQAIKEQYVQTIDSAGSYGESIAEFRVEKITDTSSIIIYQEEFFGQGIIGKSAHLLFKGKRILFLEDYEVQTSNFDPEDAVDGVDTNMIWTDIFVNPKESTIFINTTDWTDYMKIGEKYNWSEYKLRNNKFVKIKSGDTLR